jgi:DNA-binding MarR family transcriptional regulator
MEIPIRDTPTRAVIEMGYGGEVDLESVQDCMDFLRVAKKTLAYFLQKFLSQDLSPGKYSVLMELMTLAERESLSPSELAHRLGVTRPTITGLIDGLIRQKYVVRKAAQKDRRKISISLTTDGRQLMTNLLPDQFAAMSAIVSGINIKDRTRLRGLLDSIEQNVDLQSKRL